MVILMVVIIVTFIINFFLMPVISQQSANWNLCVSVYNPMVYDFPLCVNAYFIFSYSFSSDSSYGPQGILWVVAGSH